MLLQPKNPNKSLCLELPHSEFFFKAIGTEIIKLSQFIGQLITSLKQINAAKKLIEASGEKAPPSIYLFIPLVLLAANDAGINSEQTDELLRRTNLVLVLDQLAESGKLAEIEGSCDEVQPQKICNFLYHFVG